ncbi:MAG: hypothetical protein QXV61_00070 [Archaeoglobaceae archaeon]
MRNSMLIDPRCKICCSQELEKINEMIIAGKPYSEIINSFPELKLTKSNITRHKRHFNFVAEGVAKYEKIKAQLEAGANKIVDELKALDATIARMHHYVQTIDPVEKPRALEVAANTMLRAIKLKHEIMGNISDPGQKLLELFAEDE